MKVHLLRIVLLAFGFTGLLLAALTIETRPLKAQETKWEWPVFDVPKDNPSTKEKVELGKQLYFDPRLSSTSTLSCNSCHNVMAGGDDTRATSMGVRGQEGGRNAPTVWNSAFHSVQFWDGRAASLEEQAKGPLINPIEMGMKDHDVVVDRIEKIPGYVKQFKKVFGGKKPVTIDNAAKAIAAYERTLVTTNSAFDKFMKGNKKALTAQEIKGWETFQSVGCVSCHMGPNFSGPKLPMGTGFFQKFPVYPNAQIEKKYKFQKDPGKMEATKKEADRNMWRVPTLRNVAITAPYFHNGAVNSLSEAVKVMGKLQLNKDLSHKEVDAIVAFLNTLTGEFPKQDMPRLPEYRNTSF